MTSVTTAEISRKEPIISRSHYPNDWRAFGVFCCRTRTKGGRTTALNPLIAPNARRIFNPVRLSNARYRNHYFSCVRELSVSFSRRRKWKNSQNADGAAMKDARIV